jgi:hypothetical protein
MYYINMKKKHKKQDTTSGAGTADPSGTHEFAPGF